MVLAKRRYRHRYEVAATGTVLDFLGRAGYALPPMKKPYCFLLLLAGAGLWLACPVDADDQADRDRVEVTRTASEGGFQVAAGLNHQFRTDIDGGGEFAVTRGYGWVAVPRRLGADLSLVTRFRFELAGYDFTGPSTPWDVIQQYHLTAVLRFQRSEQWVIFAGPTVRWAGETGADFGDGFHGGGFAGVGYKASPRLDLAAGIGAVSQIEDHALVLPVLRVTWQFADQWWFRLGTVDVGNAGIGGTFDWQVSDPLRLSLGGFYQNNRFQLDDSGANRGGVGEDTGFALFVNLRWEVNRQFALDAHTGLVLGGELEVDDAPAGTNFDTDYDPAPFIGLRGVVRF